MANDEIAARVSRVIADEFLVPEQQIHDESRLVEEIGLDSFNVVELIAVLEEEFGIKIGDAAFAEIRTVGQVAQALEQMIGQ